MIDRHYNRDEYFKNFYELENTPKWGEELFDLIVQYIQKPQTPLSSYRREILLDELDSQRGIYINNPHALFSLKSNVCVECQPTYFNLMKVMYPLLADVYDLNILTYGYNAVLAGMNIGNHEEPIEKTIAAVKNKFPSGSFEGRLIDRIESQLACINNPAFFGYWQENPQHVFLKHRVPL